MLTMSQKGYTYKKSNTFFKTDVFLTIPRFCFCTRSSNLSVRVAPIRSLTIERVLLLDAHWR